MKLDFNFNLTTPKGDAIEGDVNAATLLSGAVASSSQTKNVSKLWGWVVKLANGQAIEVDDQDYRLLVEVIEQNQTLSLLTKGQLLAAMDSVKNPPQPCAQIASPAPGTPTA